MSVLIIKGKQAVRINRDGSGLDSTTNYQSNCDNFGPRYTSQYGKIIDLIDNGNTLIAITESRREIQFDWNNGCPNFKCVR